MAYDPTTDVPTQTLPFVDLPSTSTPVLAAWLNHVDEVLTDIAGPAGTGTGIGAAGYIDINEFGTIVTSGSSDHYSVFAAAVAGAPEGATIWVPPVPDGETYRLSQTLVIDRHVNFAGMWAREKNDDTSDEPFGTIIQPTSSGAQATMTDGMIHVENSWVKLEGLFCLGHGQAEGGIGIRFAGTDPGADGLHCHGAQAVRCGAVEFETGFMFGEFSDHITVKSCTANGNRDGVSFEEDNHYDHYCEDCLLDGNVRSSVFLPDNVPTDNFVMVRCHLGFSEYGIYNPDTTDSGNGFSGLTMIGCPIEFVTLGHMVLGTAGLLHVVGGYWGWGDDPASPCVTIRHVEHGPCYLNPRLDSGLANANATAFVEVLESANYRITIDTPHLDFTGDAPAIIGTYSPFADAPYTATFIPEPDYAAQQSMTCTGNVAVDVPAATARTDIPLRLVFVASGATRSVTFDTDYRTTAAGTRGAHSVASGESLIADTEYINGDWVLLRTLITAT